MAMGYPKKWKTDRFRRKAPAPLKFGADGRFKILHITDIHCVQPVMDDDEIRAIPEGKYKETINVIEKLVEKTNPDMVVFGGDNISGYWQEFTYNYVKQTIDDITAPIRARNIPLGICFGNHDGECGFHTEFQMMMYMEYDNCRSNLNDSDVYGCGNCCITIKDSKGEKDAFALWLMDSGDYEKVGEDDFRYDHLHNDQIAWYEKRAAELKETNGGKPVPAILFQHIPVQQELDFIEKGTETDYDVKFGDNILKCKGIVEGRVREYPCPPNPEKNHRNQFESWKKTGDIVAAFFGHDHVNDFRIDVDGISLYQTLGAGYFTYGAERGGRLIVLNENNPAEIQTETIEIASLS